MSGNPSDFVMEPSFWFAPGTDLDAATTRSPVRIGDSKLGTGVHIKLPGLIAVIHNLVTHRDRFGRTGNGTFPALLTKFLEAKVNRFIRQ